MANPTNRRFVVDNQRGSLADVDAVHRSCAPANRRTDHDKPATQRDERGICAAAHAIIFRRLKNFAGHVAADAVRKKNRRGLRAVAVNHLAAQIFGGNVDAQLLNFACRLGDVRNIFVGDKFNRAPVASQSFLDAA